VNGDGKVGILDLVLLNQYLINKLPDTTVVVQIQAADVNGDQILNVVDVILCRRYLLGEITKFPIE